MWAHSGPWASLYSFVNLLFCLENCFKIVKNICIYWNTFYSAECYRHWGSCVKCTVSITIFIYSMFISILYLKLTQNIHIFITTLFDHVLSQRSMNVTKHLFTNQCKYMYDLISCLNIASSEIKVIYVWFIAQ